MLKKLTPRECAKPYSEDGKLTVLACLEPGSDLLRQVRFLEDAESRLRDKANFHLAEEDCLDILRQSFQVSGTPTFILFRGGREVDRRIGLLTNHDLEQFVMKNLDAALPEDTKERREPEMEIHDSYAILRLPREITLQHSHALKRSLTPKMVEAQASNMVLDLSNVAKMDSSGLGVLVHWNTQLASSGKVMHLFKTSQSVRKCLDIAALSDFFHYLESDEDLHFLD